MTAVLTNSGLLGSNGEVKRMVAKNAVSFVDGDKITAFDFALTDDYKGQVIKVGKRAFKAGIGMKKKALNKLSSLKKAF